MWIRVATDLESVKMGQAGNKYIDGDHIEEYYFDETVAKALDEDQFLPEMWKHLDAMFDWGDCDFFEPDRCRQLLCWLNRRLQDGVSPVVKPVYEEMKRYAGIAIDNKTGIYFDF